MICNIKSKIENFAEAENSETEIGQPVNAQIIECKSDSRRTVWKEIYTQVDILNFDRQQTRAFLALNICNIYILPQQSSYDL